jgi:RNA polymerase sigma-70 factor (ECF subfamily)
MTDVTEPFEQHRSHLRAVAFRMLGSQSEADDAVQEAWLRLQRSDASSIDNLGGWLTTVVARVCLDMLRSRTSRREEPITPNLPEPTAPSPEHEQQLAETVGLAALVVLDTLEPAERLAFVLHDMFGVPFDDIARIVDRSPAAARQLASRARRRVHGAQVPEADLRAQRGVVEAFLAALRAGDVEGLIAVLDPDVVAHAGANVIRGARDWAKGAVAFAAMVQHMQPMLVDGVVGLVFAPRGRVTRALQFTIERDRIARVEVIMDQESLEALELAALD